MRPTRWSGWVERRFRDGNVPELAAQAATPEGEERSRRPGFRRPGPPGPKSPSSLPGIRILDGGAAVRVHRNKAQASPLSAPRGGAAGAEPEGGGPQWPAGLHSARYPARLKSSKMSAADARVRCLWIFEGSATAYSAHILAILWLGIQVLQGGRWIPGAQAAELGSPPTFMWPPSLASPEGLPDLPRQRTAMRSMNPPFGRPPPWQWTADLLQYWSDVSTRRLRATLHTQSTLVERLMDTVTRGSQKTPRHVGPCRLWHLPLATGKDHVYPGPAGWLWAPTT